MLDDVGVKDIKEGRIDPRVVAVLTKLSQEHKITVSCMCSDHSKFTAGGSVSNHFAGRGLDIAAIDGETVGPGSPLAREVASELSTLNEDYRPNEIGSPFAIAGPGYFTDAAHQNHLHVGFKQEIPRDWKPPKDVAVDGAKARARRGAGPRARRRGARGRTGGRRRPARRARRARRPGPRRRPGGRGAQAQTGLAGLPEGGHRASPPRPTPSAAAPRRRS